MHITVAHTAGEFLEGKPGYLLLVWFSPLALYFPLLSLHPEQAFVSVSLVLLGSQNWGCFVTNMLGPLPAQHFVYNRCLKTAYCRRTLTIELPLYLSHRKQTPIKCLLLMVTTTNNNAPNSRVTATLSNKRLHNCRKEAVPLETTKKSSLLS